MARYLDLASLPENVARYAQGQVAAGRFASLEEVLSAGSRRFYYRRAA
jgi:Arc/MetJ-type ribon-helix-helix transcriptional regulator